VGGGSSATAQAKSNIKVNTKTIVNNNIKLDKLVKAINEAGKLQANTDMNIAKANILLNEAKIKTEIAQKNKLFLAQQDEFKKIGLYGVGGFIAYKIITKKKGRK